MQKGSNPKVEKQSDSPARWPVSAVARERVHAQPLTPRGTVGVPLRVAKPPVQPEEYLRNLRCLQFAFHAAAPRQVGGKVSREGHRAESR